MGMIMKDGIPYGGIYPIDDAPTQGSNNAVKSGGVHSALSNKVDKVAGKGLSTNDYDNTEKEQNEANAEAIEAIVNRYGAKNLIPNNVTSQTINGVTFTVNADGSITTNGTATDDVFSFLFENVSIPSGKEVILTGCPSGGSTDTFFMTTMNARQQWNDATDYGSGASTSNGVIHVSIVIRSGYTCNNLTFYPMIRDARIADPTYAPYAMTNTELTKVVAAVEPLTNRTRNNITNKLSNLLTAVSEQNLEKYGYKIGDYFTGPSGYTYHLADMDTFYGGYWNYAIVTIHHVGVVVDTHTTSKWTDGSVVAYDASTLHAFLTGTALNNIKSDMIALFGGSTGLEHLVSNYKLYAGVGSWAWGIDEYISALTEVQIYGCPIWSIDTFQQGEAVRKLKLFDDYRFNEIFGNNVNWLRSLASSSLACVADAVGLATAHNISATDNVSGLILLH